MHEDIKWTKSYFESLNERLEAVGMPKFIIRDGFVYKDELHAILGIGKNLKRSLRALLFLFRNIYTSYYEIYIKGGI